MERTLETIRAGALEVLGCAGSQDRGSGEIPWPLPMSTHNWEVSPLLLGLAGGSRLCMRDVEVTTSCLCLCPSVPAWKRWRTLKAPCAQIQRGVWV